MTQIEETLAHLTRTVEDLSDVVARQEREIETLKRRVQMLLEREAERQSEGSGGVVLGDERPPHW
ncbi:MAG: SlyX family protein [Pseudomonadota bacterium]